MCWPGGGVRQDEHGTPETPLTRETPPWDESPSSTPLAVTATWEHAPVYTTYCGNAPASKGQEKNRGPTIHSLDHWIRPAAQTDVRQTLSLWLYACEAKLQGRYSNSFLKFFFSITVIIYFYYIIIASRRSGRDLYK